MLDPSVSYNRYMFLGHEFLTWLWFAVEKDQPMLQFLQEDLQSIEIGNRIVIENHSSADEVVTIKGEEAGFEEGFIALGKGAFVSEMNLIYISADQEWRFTVKGESLNISNLKTPETGSVETQEDVEGAVLEKAYLYEKVVRLLNDLFKAFIRLRISEDWKKDVVPKMKHWIQGN